MLLLTVFSAKGQVAQPCAKSLSCDLRATVVLSAQKEPS